MHVNTNSVASKYVKNRRLPLKVKKCYSNKIFCMNMFHALNWNLMHVTRQYTTH